MSSSRARAFPIAGMLLALAARGDAEQLPLKTYTTSDGLPSDRIHCIFADSHGYLWFGTSNGLSRFDGYRFTNLGTGDGLPGPETTAILESRDGTFWAATNRGLLHWDPARQAPGSPHAREAVHLGDGAADEVQALLEDSDGTAGGELWAATRAGLHRVSRSRGEWKAKRVVFEAQASPAIVNALSKAPGGGLFVGTEDGLFRVRADGSAEPVEGPRGPVRAVRSLLQEPGGPLWIGTLADGVLRLAADGGRAWAAFRRENGLAGNHVTSMLRTEDGAIWASCFGGISKIETDRRGVRSYTSAEGLTGYGMWSLAQDSHGSVWIGSDDAGVMRLAPGGFRRFGAGDGLTSTRIGALFDGPRGEPCALTRGRRREELADDEGLLECFDGRRFRAQSPRLPDGTPWGWGWQRLALVDGSGEWWVPTFAGLFRFPAVPFDRLGAVSPIRRYTSRDGLPSDMVYRLFADSRGDLWLGLAGDVATPLVRWSRAADRFEVIRGAAIPSELPMSFAEDRTGAVWIGYLHGGLLRVRGGEVRVFGERDGLPPGSVRDLLVDRGGRLWAATALGGLARLERPDVEPPRFTRLSTPQGLSSESVSSLGEDGSGRIYAGTERGLDRIDPARGSIQHFSSDDGLAAGVVECIHRDAAGHLWFGSVEGLSRLDPAPLTPSRPPSVRITRVLLDGVPQSVAELGADRVVLADPSREAAPLEIEYGGIDIRPGGRLRYQHRLEGIDRDWSAPADQRSVVYARIPAGSYRFLARAVGNDGAVSDSPAEVRFRVLPPLWRRPPVLALIAASAALIAYALHRMRLTRALEVERVRSRVARDLHDDVGAGLSEIAILSEVAAQNDGRPPHADAALTEIGDAARRLVDSMSDIVWSTDPRKDDAASLVARIRHFAANTLESRRIGWSLDVAPQFESRPLDAETRRQMLLIVKEALTNVARHSGCTRASVRIEAAGPDASIEIADDGRGLAGADGNGSGGGHGLGNMRARAESLGGSLRVESGPEAGTRIRVLVPLGRRGRRTAPPA